MGAVKVAGSVMGFPSGLCLAIYPNAGPSGGGVTERNSIGQAMVALTLMSTLFFW